MELLKNHFTCDEIDTMLKEVRRLEKEKDRENYIWKYYEKNNNTKINRIEYFVKNSSLIDIAKKFETDDYILMKDKVNFKYPYSEQFLAHQDISAGWGKYGDEHISYAIPLDNTNEDNGCLFVADIGINKMLTPLRCDLEDSIVSPELYKPVETQKGDVIKFDSFIPHKSFINKTDKERIILYFTYTKKQGDKNIYEWYHKDKFENVPPDIYKIKGQKYRNGNTNELISYT